MDQQLIKDNIVVDSFEDIAVNKIRAIYGREPSDPKDYADLYFILEDSEYSIDYLISRAKDKEQAFEEEFGRVRATMTRRTAVGLAGRRGARFTNWTTVRGSGFETPPRSR